MRVRLSTGLWQWRLRSRAEWYQHVGSGAVLHRSGRSGYVTLHAVGSCRGPHHNASCTRRSLPQRDATHLKRGGIGPPKTKTVALPVSPPAVMPPAATLSAYAVPSALISTPSGTIPVST